MILFIVELFTNIKHFTFFQQDLALNNLKSLQCHKIYMILFGWVLWHINHCRLFNAKSCLY